MATTPKKSIHEALIAAQAAVKAVAKNNKNSFDNYNYRGIDDVMDAVHDAFTQAGVVAVPEVLDVQQTDRQSRKGDVMIHTVVTVKYMLYASDGTSVSAIVKGEALDRGDKSLNKSMSAAYKTFAFQLLAIPVGMIDSETESPEIGQAPAAKAPVQRAAATKPVAKTAAPVKPSPESPIPTEAARKISNMVAVIDAVDKEWWPSIKEAFGFNKSVEIKQKDYNTVVTQSTKKLTELRNAGLLDADYKPIEAEKEPEKPKKEAQGKTDKEKEEKPAEAKKEPMTGEQQELGFEEVEGEW